MLIIITVNIIISLPLSDDDTTSSTKLCNLIWSFRQGKVPLAPVRGTHGSSGGKMSHPTNIPLWWSRQPPIGGEWIGPEQERRFYWCGVSEYDGRMWGGWWGYLIDRSRPSSAHTRGLKQVLQELRRLQLLCEWQKLETEGKSGAALTCANESVK